jgi:hypothetical protein
MKVLVENNGGFLGVVQFAVNQMHPGFVRPMALLGSTL